jgi:hypothetical protein
MLAAAALIVAASGSRRASANLLTNGGLELSAPAVTAPNEFLIVQTPTTDSTTLPGWTISGAVDVVPASYWQNTEGNDSVDMIGSTGLGSLSQTVTGLAPGATYGISFDVAVNPSLYQGEGITTKQLQLTVTNPASSILAMRLYQGTAGTATRNDMQYITESLTFVATSSSETLNFAALTPTDLPAGLNGATVACGSVIDNVDMEFISGTVPTNVAPEPASLGLLAAGSLLLRRRKTARSH